jgi:hypothetical protein
MEFSEIDEMLTNVINETRSFAANVFAAIGGFADGHFEEFNLWRPLLKDGKWCDLDKYTNKEVYRPSHLKEAAEIQAQPHGQPFCLPAKCPSLLNT